MLPVVSITATVSALASGSLPAIQIAKLWRSRSSAGISLVWVLGSLANSVIWNVYALLLGNLTLILPNALSLLMNLAMAAVVLAVRHPRLSVDGAARRLQAELAALEAVDFSLADTLILRPAELGLGV